VLRQFSGSLGVTPHIAVDSLGNIFVADFDNRHILLLDNHLSLRRVIIDEHQLSYESKNNFEGDAPLAHWAWAKSPVRRCHPGFSHVYQATNMTTTLANGKQSDR